MDTPRMFTGINKKDPLQPSKPINVHALIGKAVVFLIIIVLAGYALISMLSVLTKVSSNWQELRFAYDQPSIVKAVRLRYTAKSDAVNAEFLNETPDIASVSAVPTEIPTDTPTPSYQQTYKTQGK